MVCREWESACDVDGAQVSVSRQSGHDGREISEGAARG